MTPDNNAIGEQWKYPFEQFGAADERPLADDARKELFDTDIGVFMEESKTRPIIGGGQSTENITLLNKVTVDLSKGTGDENGVSEILVTPCISRSMWD